MARLFIVVGYPDSKPTSEPFSVYVGSSGEAMRAAKAKSTAARFVEYHNVPGIRKNNPNAAANLAAEQAVAVSEKKAAKPESKGLLASVKGVLGLGERKADPKGDAPA